MQVKHDIKVTWDDAVKQFQNLVKFASKQGENYNQDTAISVEDMYQEGMIKLYDCWYKWCFVENKDMDEFQKIFKKSLFRAIRKPNKKMLETTDIEDITTIASASYDPLEDLFKDEVTNMLRESLENPISVLLLDEMLEPSEATLYQMWADVRRKEMLKSQGHKVHIPKTVVRMKHIAKALGITSKQYDVAMLEIKQKSKTLISQKDREEY